MRQLRVLGAAALLVFMAAQGLLAQQDPFGVALTVNGRVVTNYEIDQRVRFLTLLRAPGNSREDAEKALIDERLQLQAARQADITVSEQEIQEGLAEFAGRANLDVAQFTRVLAQGGVAPETFRAFVTAGLAWRKLVRARFAPKAQVSDRDLERAATQARERPNLRLRLAEIILPATPEFAQRSSELAERLSATLKTEAAFSSAARQYSASATRGNGGLLPWTPSANLPPQLLPILLALAPGEVTRPISLGEAIAIFQLRAVEEPAASPAPSAAIEYATMLLPGGQAGLAAAAAIRAQVDTCDDLYGVLRRTPNDSFARQTAAPDKIPGDVSMEIARLDENESSATLTRGGGRNRLFVMVCDRESTLAAGEGARDQIRQGMVNQRLTAYADGYLAQLRSNAVIRRP